jgi:cbb3-type cytochrome oxidase subunit 3
MENIIENIRKNATVKGTLLSLLVVAFFIVFINVASAMYGGESISFETNFTNPVYIVTGNSSNLDGLNVTFDNRNIIVSSVVNYKPDNFTLTFFDNITNEIIKEVRVGGSSGSSRTKYIDRNITVYVPEYINKTIEVEKIVKAPAENMEISKNGYEFWNITLILIISIGLVIFSLWDRRKKE